MIVMVAPDAMSDVTLSVRAIRQTSKRAKQSVKSDCMNRLRTMR